MSGRTKKLTTMALMTAIAYGVVFLIRIPVSFLTLDPKSTIITIAGFMMGPLPALIMSIVVSFIEMITVSVNGPIGFLMNSLSTISFCCVAALIYSKHRNIKGAVIGLSAGTLVLTAVMLLWNWLILPLYMEGITRDQVVSFIMPLLLPFNLIKGALNMALTLLLYKPISIALKKAKLLPDSGSGSGTGKRKINLGLLIFAALLLITCIMLLLALMGII